MFGFGVPPGFIAVVRDSKDKRLRELTTNGQSHIGSLACVSGLVFVAYGATLIVVENANSIGVADEPTPASPQSARP